MDSQTHTRCSVSRISPCQVQELEVLGALSCCCAPGQAVPPPCARGVAGAGGTGLPPPLLGQSSHLGSTRLLLLSENVPLGRPEGGRKELLAHGVSCRFQGLL